MHRSLVRGRSARRRLAAVLALVLPLALSACGASGDSSAGGAGGTTQVKVGVIPIIDVAPIYLGIKQGFFKQQHLSVSLQTAQGGAAIVPGVVSGQYQFGFSNVVSLMLAQNQGLRLKAVASGVASTGSVGNDFGGVIVPKNSTIRTAADLAGKKIAVNTLKNINTVTVDNVVKKAGGDTSKISYSELEFPDIVSAVAKGDVDAGQVVEPFLTMAKQAGDRVVAWNYADTDPNLEVAEYFTSQAYAQQNPQVVKEFTAAMKKSLDFAQQHPDAVRSILGSYTDLDPKLAKAVTLPKWPSTVNSSAMQTLANLSVQDGVLAKKPDLTSLLP